MHSDLKNTLCGIKVDEDKFTWLGKTLQLPGVDRKDPAPQRMEALRTLLKDKLGDARFQAVYDVMTAMNTVGLC